MRVIRHFVGNDLRNFNYLVACDESKTAVAIDPLDAEYLLAIAECERLEIKFIVNTHEHFDHINGNPLIRKLTGALICAHHSARDSIPGVDIPLKDGDAVDFGFAIFEALHTPGHTKSHLCLLSKVVSQNCPAMLFSGDTLFNASAGNCRNGGNVHDMYMSFAETLSQIDGATCLYPGHDYLLNNLNFALACDPSNLHAAALREKVLSGSQGDLAPVMTLAEERTYNPFLRLHDEAIVQHVRASSNKPNPTPEEVFIALRLLRDNW